MRITGGKVKGRRLASPKGLNIRPTTDKVREAIFNIIGHDFSGLRVIDLFAGTGSLGLEALSRGAFSVTFIDYSGQAIKLIKRNLLLCGYQTSGIIIKKDLRNGLPRKHAIMKEKFDLVFLDPPYRKGFAPFLLQEISTRLIISSNSRVIIETSKNEVLPVSYENLEIVDTRLYGDTKISIYTYEAKE